MKNDQLERIREYRIEIMTAEQNIERLNSLRRQISKDREVEEDDIDILLREINEIIDCIWEKRSRF